VLGSDGDQVTGLTKHRGHAPSHHRGKPRNQGIPCIN